MGLISADKLSVSISDRWADSKPRVSDMPYLYDIAEGNIVGHSGWSKTGYCLTSGTSQVTCWNPATEYAWPSAEMRMEVVSTDSSHTHDHAGGDGAITVWINYLNLAGAEKTETVTLNGDTAVATSASDIYRIQNFRVATTGSTGKAFGTISLRSNADHTTVYSQIAAGYTRARGIFWTVPAGKTLYVSSISFSAVSAAANKYVRFTTHATWDNARQVALTKGTMFMGYSEVLLNNGAYTKTLELPTKLPSGTDIKVSVMSEASGASCFCALRGWTETN